MQKSFVKTDNYRNFTSAVQMVEVLNIIATIEQIAKVNGLETVDVPDLEGMALSHDWQARTPRGVRVRRGKKAASIAGLPIIYIKEPCHG